MGKGKDPRYPGGNEAVKPDYVVSLNGNYLTSLGAVRDALKNGRTDTLTIGLQLPRQTSFSVVLQLRCSDVYVIGFLGNCKIKETGTDASSRSGTKYHFADQEGWGVVCNVQSDYNSLPPMPEVNGTHIDQLNQFPDFLENGGDDFEQAVVIAIAVISESLRFPEVAEDFARLFAGITSMGCGRPVSLDRRGLFQNWDKMSRVGCDRVSLQPADLRGARTASSSSSQAQKTSPTTVSGDGKCSECKPREPCKKLSKLS